MNYKYLIPFSILFLLFLPSSAFADSVNISVDLPIFTKSDIITIHGTISTETTLQILITNPDEITVAEENIVLSSGDFSYNIVLGNYDLGRSGTYTISVLYDESLIDGEFFYDSGYNVNPIDVSNGIDTISESDQIIVFSIGGVMIVGIVIFLARGSIFRKKTEYDSGDWASKKNRDYEKYHSDWMNDEINFERDGKKKLSDEEFRESLLANNLPDYYMILEIEKDVNQDEIKSQYRRLAKRWHPDKDKSHDAENKMTQINMAYEVLSDQKRRKMYDQYFSKT